MLDTSKILKEMWRGFKIGSFCMIVIFGLFVGSIFLFVSVFLGLGLNLEDNNTFYVLVAIIFATTIYSYFMVIRVIVYKQKLTWNPLKQIKGDKKT